MNLFAAVIIMAASVGVSTTDAAEPVAVTYLSCADMAAALDSAAERCWDMGGSSLSYSGSCSDSGYVLSVTCWVNDQ